MRAFGVIGIIVLFMAIFALLLVPMSEGSFPSWIDTNIVEFMLFLLLAACVIALIAR